MRERERILKKATKSGPFLPSPLHAIEIFFFFSLHLGKLLCAWLYSLGTNLKRDFLLSAFRREELRFSFFFLPTSHVSGTDM